MGERGCRHNWSGRCVRVGLSLVAAAAGPAGQLGENDLEALPDLRTEGRYRNLIGHSSDVVYFKIGTDSYLLCRRDLDRLHAMGYVYRKERGYHLSRLGRLLLDRHDNARLLAKGVARAKRNRYLRCRGGLWLRLPVREVLDCRTRVVPPAVPVSEVLDGLGVGGAGCGEVAAASPSVAVLDCCRLDAGQPHGSDRCGSR